MSFLKNIFRGKKEAPIRSYEDFWKWFETHEKAFWQAVKNRENIEKNFFNIIHPKLNELREGFFF